MPALIDTNVLFALTNDWHKHNALARTWFNEQTDGSVVVVRTVQLSLLRLLSTDAVMMGSALPLRDCWAVWETLLIDRRVRFQKVEPTGIDPKLAELIANKSISPKLWADLYLAAFAISEGISLVSFDRGFSDIPGVAFLLLA